VDLNESIVGIIALFVIAGGGIVAIDWLIIRRLREGAKLAQEAPADADEERAGTLGRWLTNSPSRISLLRMASSDGA
jgi:hypothetical protein